MKVKINKIRGLTLVELMIVVAVITLLAAIALPLYEAQVIKSRRTDGRTALHAIAVAEERFFTTNGSYTAAFNQLDLNSDLNNGTSENGFYTLNINAGTTTFTATATPTGGQANDSDCTSMSINQLGVKSGTGADSDKCW